MAKRPKPDADDARVDVDLRVADGRRIVQALRQRSQHAMADWLAGEVNGHPADTVVCVKPKIRTCADIANVCATAGIQAGNAFGVAASYGRYRESVTTEN